MHKHTYRERSINSIIKEILSVTKNSKDNKITIIDDIFTVNKKRVIEFSNKIKKYNIIWGCSSRINTIDEELLHIMSASGCKGIFFGLESGSIKIMNSLNRNYTTHNVIKIFNLCKKLDINAYGSFIIGLPFENEKDIMDTLLFANKLHTSQIRIGPLQVYPGTKIWKNPEKYGIILNKNIDFSTIDNDNRSHFSTNWINKEKITEYNMIGRQISQSKLNYN